MGFKDALLSRVMVKNVANLPTRSQEQKNWKIFCRFELVVDRAFIHLISYCTDVAKRLDGATCFKFLNSKT